MDTNKLIKILITITAILIFLNIVNILIGEPSWQVTRLIHVDFEANFSTWFSSILLAIAAYFAYKCSIIKNIDKREQTMLQLFGSGLLLMSCDETAQIRENLAITINKYIFKLENMFSSAWAILLGPIAVTVLVLFSILLIKYAGFSRKVKKFLTIGLIIYITGAFILELAINFTPSWFWSVHMIIEESFEMFGVLFVIKGLMEHNKAMKQRYAVCIK